MDNQRINQERERLDHFECPERDRREHPPVGVLLSDEIERYVNEFKLISPFRKDDQLKPAGYELSIGDEYVLGGEKRNLGKDGEIRIPPFNVVVIKTNETINLPRFLIARWNVRVRWAYEGLLWVGAAQVDPGWVGHLFCPLYNLSNKEVVLRSGDPIALMDFVTTTEFKSGTSKVYPRPPNRVLLEQYQAVELKSALYTLATTRLDTYETQLKQIKSSSESRVAEIQSRIDNFVLITFSVIAVLFAAITIFVARSEQPSWWNPVLFIISGTAIFLSATAWMKTKHEQKLFGRAAQVIIILFLLVATVLQLIEVRPFRSQFEDMKKRVDQLEQQVKGLSVKPASTQVSKEPVEGAPIQTPSGKANKQADKAVPRANP
jgi:deoxycytidine triphosphate deaminase